MEYLTYIPLTFLVFFCMEGVTWLMHKYVMHGIGWYFHEDHHEPGYQHTFEKNDIYFVLFAVPCITGMYYGTIGGITWLFSVCLGVLFYGICYFLIHDVLIHRRFKWFDKTNNWYFRALRKAHKIHHKHIGKEDGECFGMLFVPLKYFREAKSAQQPK